MMKKVLIELNENQKVMADEIRTLNCEIEEMKINHFDADPTVISFLIVVTPVVVKQLAEIIKIMISSPSKGKVKIEGVEIEGFSYHETLELLNVIARKNEEEETRENDTYDDVDITQ